MLKPQMPNIPGVGVVTDTLDFVKNLWGSMSVPGVNIPGMAAPTLSIDDLDKKIADLKAVESWLNVNTSMLRGTIQALEVQRGTIATLKSMGASLAAAVKQPGANEKTVLAAAPFASAFFVQPEAAAPAAAAQTTSPPAEAARSAPETAAKPAASKTATAPKATLADAATAAGAMGNPSAWWNLLHDQFKQAVSTAMTSDTLAGASAMAQDAAAKFAAASARPAGELGKAVAKTLTPAAAKKPAAKSTVKRAATKAKPKVTKPA
ncbi:MAG: PhaM family polyhydroxyalkanoate granule multifunctional regulatory protein [Pseudomonadota bacterium]